MRIKSFNSFNESITNVASYKKILSKYAKIDREDLEDRLIEVTDLGVKLDSLEPRIVDENGLLMKSNSYLNKFFISYNISLSYQVDNLFQMNLQLGKTYDVDKFNEKLKSLVEIQETISKVIKNISKIYGLNLVILKVTPFINEEYNRYTYKITLTSDQISIDDINKISSDYEKTYQGRAEKAYDEIKKYMEEKGVKKPALDFNWDKIDEFEGTEDDYLPMGFFTEDEIIVIAHWKPFTNTIEYDEGEVYRSIDAYENGEMEKY